MMAASGRERHHRRSIRLQGYDYGRSGAYYVTLCTQNRACLFGEVVDTDMHLNDAGSLRRMHGVRCPTGSLPSTWMHS